MFPSYIHQVYSPKRLVKIYATLDGKIPEDSQVVGVVVLHGDLDDVDPAAEADASSSPEAGCSHVPMGNALLAGLAALMLRRRWWTSPSALFDDRAPSAGRPAAPRAPAAPTHP